MTDSKKYVFKIIETAHEKNKRSHCYLIKTITNNFVSKISSYAQFGRPDSFKGQQQSIIEKYVLHYNYYILDKLSRLQIINYARNKKYKMYLNKKWGFYRRDMRISNLYYY